MLIMENTKSEHTKYVVRIGIFDKRNNINNLLPYFLDTDLLVNKLVKNFRRLVSHFQLVQQNQNRLEFVQRQV